MIGGQGQGRPDDRADDRVGHQVGYPGRYPVEGRTSGYSVDTPAPWQAEPERAIHRRWLLVAMVVIVLLVGSAFVALMVGGDDPVDRADPTQISAPVTLPASVPPAPKPSAQPSATLSGDDAGDGAGDMCPGSDSVSADDQPGWGHETVQGSDAACAGRFSVHTTSEAGGVFYRWTTEPVAAGSCDVAVYIPDTDRANLTRVSYSVLDGDRLVEGFVIAQANHHGELVAAGTYPVTGGQALTVRMSTQSATPGTVVASAVRVTCHQS